MSLIGKWFGFGRDEDYDRGIQLFDHGEYDRAIESFERCLATTHDEAARRLARFYVAQSYAALGGQSLEATNFDQAAQHLSKAVLAHPHFADLRYQLALALRGTGDFEGALRESEAALNSNPRYVDALLIRGWLLYRLGRRHDALECFERAATLDASLRNDHLVLGIEYSHTGDHDRALENLELLRSAEPVDANAHAHAADALARKGLWDQAEHEYQRALTLANYPDIRCRYAQVLLQLDRVEEAADQLRRALDVNGQYADANAYLGIALRRLGDLDGAKAAFQRALDKDPHHVVAGQEIERIR